MTREIPHSPVALYEVAHLFWSSRRGNHLGQRSCVSAETGRTYGRKRSDQSTAKTSCEEGALHIWGMSDSIIWIVVGGIVGAILGSFIDCARYRLPRGISLHRPAHSYCASCG